MTPERRRNAIIGLWIAAVLVGAPASAQIVQSVSVGMGLFFPRGFDSRNSADTLVADLIADVPLEFDIGQFKSGQFFGEWNIQFGNHLEVGAGVGYYRSQVLSAYRNRVSVAQVLHLQIVPVTGIARFFPFGTPSTVQPYVGAGISALQWRYSESGRFVDTRDNSEFNGSFAATGSTIGRVFLGGLRVPVGSSMEALTVEWRYQFGVGKTGGLPAGFLGDKIDLSGGTVNFGFLGRF